MSKLSTFALEIKLEFGKCQNQIMEMILSVNNNDPIWIQPDANGLVAINLNIDLPSQVVLQFKGKDANTGTIVDANGNIVEDMYVKFLSIALDGFNLSEKFLHQKIKLLAENGQEIFSSYVGFNGIVVLDLTESDVFSQYLKMNL